MTLNGTLVAQAINFGIAYCLLRWLYFKPAIAQIQQEEDVNAHLKNTIVERSALIAQKKQQQKEYWLTCQHYCQDQMPPIQKPDALTLRRIAHSVERVVCDKAELKKLSERVIDVLVQRIDHVS